MTNPLVKFPDVGDLWEEVEGPGMYVLAVVPRADQGDSRIARSPIVLLRPKGRLLTPVPPMWGTDESRKYDADLIEEAAKILWGKGERLKAEVMRAQIPAADISMEFEQATYMGSTMRTLRSTKTGEFWQARWEDLTPCGILHLHQVHTCFVRPPILITFLGGEDG